MNGDEMKENNIDNGSSMNNVVEPNLTNTNLSIESNISIEPVLENINSQQNENTIPNQIQNNETAIVEPTIPTINPTEQINELQSTPNIEVPNENIKPQLINDENEIKTSGTAAESELFIDAAKPEAEIIDEYVIKRSVVSEEKRYKRNWIFILIVVILIIAFIVALPFITKWIGF